MTIWYGSGWWFKLWHTHDFKLYRIDFEGPFSHPSTKEAHISFCKKCRMMKIEEYTATGQRLFSTHL